MGEYIHIRGEGMEVGGVNDKGEKILKIIKNKNCTIVFVEQEFIEENLDNYYEALAKLLRKQTC